MCSIKRVIIGIFIVLIFIPFSSTANSAKYNFDVDDFIEYPFAIDGIKIPIEYATSYEEIADNLPPILVVDIKNLENRHDPSVIDKQYFITTENYYLYYYYTSIKSQYYLYLFQIQNDSTKLKYDIKFGITVDDLFDLIGKSDRVNTFETNIEHVYFRMDYGQVNFSFIDNELTAISIWLTM